MARTAQKLIAAATIARQDGRLVDALRDVKDAVALSRDTEPSSLVTSLKALGHIEADLGHHEASATAYREADQLARQAGNPLVVAHTVRHLGDALLRLGDSPGAEACYTEAAAIYGDNPDAEPMHHANALSRLARVVDSAGRSQQATALWSQALALYTTAEIPAGVEECSTRLTMGTPLPGRTR